jgi:hypothetical protein
MDTLSLAAAALKGSTPAAAAVQKRLVQLHFATSARLTPAMISAGVGSAAQQNTTQAGASMRQWTVCSRQPMRQLAFNKLFNTFEPQ